MPFFPSQEALAYLDTATNSGVLFHADSGKLWSAVRFTDPEMTAIKQNPSYQNLD